MALAVFAMTRPDDFYEVPDFTGHSPPDIEDATWQQQFDSSRSVEFKEVEAAIWPYMYHRETSSSTRFRKQFNSTRYED